MAKLTEEQYREIGNLIDKYGYGIRALVEGANDVSQRYYVSIGWYGYNHYKLNIQYQYITYSQYMRRENCQAEMNRFVKIEALIDEKYVEIWNRETGEELPEAKKIQFELYDGLAFTRNYVSHILKRTLHNKHLCYIDNTMSMEELLLTFISKRCSLKVLRVNHDEQESMETNADGKFTFPNEPHKDSSMRYYSRMLAQNIVRVWVELDGKEVLLAEKDNGILVESGQYYIFDRKMYSEIFMEKKLSL